MTRHLYITITDRPPIPAWPIILTVAVIFAFWKIVVAALAVAVLVACLWLAARWWRDSVDAQIRVHAGLRQRANEQYSALLSGDLMRGLYGQPQARRPRLAQRPLEKLVPGCAGIYPVPARVGAHRLGFSWHGRARDGIRPARALPGFPRSCGNAS